MSRRSIYRSIFLFATLIAVASVMINFGTTVEKPTENLGYAKLVVLQSQLKELHALKADPRPGDWLASHDEPGQSFAEFARSKPNRLTEQRNVLYVQPIGVFDRKRSEIVELSAEFMGLYYNCPVKTLDTMPESEIPKKARRVHPTWNVPQILSTYVLYDVLKPKLPDDAFAMIAFTSSDLWPGEGWNFVFGQASLRERVGVWSINRNGDPNVSAEDFKLCLKRTLQTATHETGHMFSMPHCIKFECNMNGSNNQEEADRQPTYLCPQCLAKTLFATDADPVARYESLATFCDEHDLEEEADFYRKSIETLNEAD